MQRMTAFSSTATLMPNHDSLPSQLTPHSTTLQFDDFSTVHLENLTTSPSNESQRSYFPHREQPRRGRNILSSVKSFFKSHSIYSLAIRAVVLLVGIGCAIGLFLWFRHIEDERFNRDLQTHCEERALKLSRDFSRNLQTVLDFAALFSTFYPNVNQQQFDIFANYSSLNQSEIRNFLFRPRVDDSRRTQWERDQNASIIVRPETATDPSPAPAAQFYFPTTMKIQSLPPFPRIGYDGLFGSGRKEAIYKVERTKAPVLSGISTIAPGLPGILLFVPLYIENKYMDPAVNFNLTGVVSAVYDVNGIFNTSFSSSPNHYNMKTLVYDKSSRSMLYESNPVLAKDVADAAITSTAPVIDKEFEFVCSPYEDSYSSRYTALPIIVFVLSLVIVLFLVAIVHSMMTKYEIMKSRELSKRKELEVSKKMLNTLSQYSKTIVKFCPDPLLFIGDGVIKGANTHFLTKTGFAVDDLVHDTQPIQVSAVLPSFDNSSVLEARQEVEVLVKRSDGSTFPAAVSISEPFQSSVSGGETRHVMLLRDLTETKKVMKALSEAKAEAQLANRIKTEILYFLCHEIRNPVHAIVALAGTINSDKPTINDAAGDISVAASFLGSLVDDILALLNVKAGLFPIQTIPVDLQTLLTTTEKQTRPLASERRVRLMLDGLEKLRGCKVVTDAYRLERTISKLLQHSLNSTPSNGLVSLAVQVTQSRLLSNTATQSTDGIQIRFVVTDTSAGYESSEIPHLFDPFNQRVSISCGKHFGGAGLCIALAKHFLGTLGSELHFESIKGSGNKISFQITFPLVSPQNCTGHCTSCESRMSVPRPSAFRNRSNTPSYPIDSGISTSHQLTSSDQLKADENIPDKKYRVLLVEDNVIVSKVTKKMLLKFGYEVEIAEHGQEAIDKIEQKDFSVILMDLVMPVLDGHEATLRLRAQGCNIPIIALTANALDTEFERCQKEGFDDFITKPVAGESLNTVIKSWLGHRSSHCKGEG